ncbi:M50 family metallopeptidase [Flavobacterium sp. B17]|uniref:M50 family metallopeptidase n=1 Tax=Flavobacterium sp. B17 TaxID=95618 RepID=UPI0005B28AE1|nr:M50 family metallopeptidase [Flavobacterium sp. B17]
MSKTKQNNPFLKLSGLFLDFFTAFLLVFLIHLLAPKSYYIENKDAIYGLEFSNTMQELGFENGDKIISINNQPVKKISEITNMILLNPNTIIKIKRNNDYTELKISDSEVIQILQSEGTPIKVKFTPNIEEGKIQNIKQTKEKFSFIKVLENYQAYIKGAYYFINPKKDYKKISGMNLNSNSFTENISLLAFCCIIVGILNILPLPGFSFGNFIISFIELRRGKKFNLKNKNIVGLCLIFIVILFIFVLHI